MASPTAAPLTETQRAYLCAFEDAMFAHRDEDHQQIAELAMEAFAVEMFDERGLVLPSMCDRRGRARGSL